MDNWFLRYPARMSTRVIGQLHVRAIGPIKCSAAWSAQEIAFHYLHVIDIVLDRKIIARHLFNDGSVVYIRKKPGISRVLIARLQSLGWANAFSSQETVYNEANHKGCPWASCAVTPCEGQCPPSSSPVYSPVSHVIALGSLLETLLLQCRACVGSINCNTTIACIPIKYQQAS